MVLQESCNVTIVVGIILCQNSAIVWGTKQWQFVDRIQTMCLALSCTYPGAGVCNGARLPESTT